MAASIFALLTGCAADAGFWDEEPTADDALPSFVDTARYEAESSRLLAATDGGHAFYVARSDPEEMLCLIIVNPDARDWVGGCVSALPIEVSLGTTEARLVEPHQSDLGVDGYVRIGDGLFVNEG